MKTSDQPVYEVWEEDKPSFLPSYIMSGFVLMGLIMLLRSEIPIWPPRLAHLFLAVWFGCFFIWMLQNSRNRTSFSSFRLTITDEVYKHTFRYAIAEKPHVEIPIKEIQRIKVIRGTPDAIEVNAENDADIYFLPRNTDLDALVAALKRINPLIEVES